MAIHGMAMKCVHCGRIFAARLGVASGEQRTTFQCPHCSTALHVRFHHQPGELKIDVTSDDVVRHYVASEAEENELLTVVVYTDLPVLRELQNHTYGESVQSPFIALMQYWGDNGAETSQRIEKMRAMRHGLFPQVRGVTSIYQTGDLNQLEKRMAEYSLDDPGYNDLHVAYRYGRFLSQLYIPISDLELDTSSSEELVLSMVACRRQDETRYISLLRSFFDDHGFGGHRRAVLDISMRCFDAADALMCAIAWENVQPQYAVAQEHFIVMRDDFRDLMSRFQSIFELASRTLVYVGAILNLARRGDPHAWDNGSTCNLKKALRMKAFEREFILNEIPLTKERYNLVSRNRRNEIGHESLMYDVSQQTLVTANDQRVSVMTFLSDYLAAVRLSQYLVTVVEKITIDLNNGLAPHSFQFLKK